MQQREAVFVARLPGNCTGMPSVIGHRARSAWSGSDSGIGKATASAPPMTGREDEDPRGTDRPSIPLGRPGAARETGAWIAWLVAEEPGYATGASFVVDGGLSLMAAVQSGRAPWR